jgi:hypothetical protein
MSQKIEINIYQNRFTVKGVFDEEFDMFAGHHIQNNLWNTAAGQWVLRNRMTLPAEPTMTLWFFDLDALEPVKEFLRCKDCLVQTFDRTKPAMVFLGHDLWLKSDSFSEQVDTDIQKAFPNAVKVGTGE